MAETEAEEQAHAAEAEAAEEKAEAESEEQEEQSQEANESRDPGSTMVASWGYDEEGEELEVEFQNGHEQSYACTQEQWEEAKDASSAGKWMHENML